VSTEVSVFITIGDVGEQPIIKVLHARTIAGYDDPELQALEMMSLLDELVADAQNEAKRQGQQLLDYTKRSQT
jgi:hypothetical protein